MSHHYQARVFAYLAGLVGTWEGTGKSTACVVSGDNTTPVKAPEQLRLTVKSGGSADYRFNFNVFDTKNKVHTTYNFVIKQHDQHLQVEGEGDISISEFYDGEMKFRTQTAMRTGFRRRFGAGTHYSLLSLETVRQLRLLDGKLLFNKAVFHNGTLIAFSDWVLSRD